MYLRAGIHDRPSCIRGSLGLKGLLHHILRLPQKSVAQHLHACQCVCVNVRKGLRYIATN